MQSLSNRNPTTAAARRTQADDEEDTGTVWKKIPRGGGFLSKATAQAFRHRLLRGKSAVVVFGCVLLLLFLIISASLLNSVRRSRRLQGPPGSSTDGALLDESDNGLPPRSSSWLYSHEEGDADADEGSGFPRRSLNVFVTCDGRVHHCLLSPVADRSTARRRGHDTPASGTSSASEPQPEDALPLLLLRLLLTQMRTVNRVYYTVRAHVEEDGSVATEEGDANPTPPTGVEDNDDDVSAMRNALARTRQYLSKRFGAEALERLHFVVLFASGTTLLLEDGSDASVETVDDGTQKDFLVRTWRRGLPKVNRHRRNDPTPEEERYVLHLNADVLPQGEISEWLKGFHQKLYRYPSRRHSSSTEEEGHNSTGTSRSRQSSASSLVGFVGCPVVAHLGATGGEAGVYSAHPTKYQSFRQFSPAKLPRDAATASSKRKRLTASDAEKLVRGNLEILSFGYEAVDDAAAKLFMTPVLSGHSQRDQRVRQARTVDAPSGYCFMSSVSVAREMLDRITKRKGISKDRKRVGEREVADLIYAVALYKGAAKRMKQLMNWADPRVNTISLSVRDIARLASLRGKANAAFGAYLGQYHNRKARDHLNSSEAVVHLLGLPLQPCRTGL